MGLEDLLAKLYEPWSAAKHNATVQLAERNTLNSGPGVRQRRTAHGTHISFRGGEGGSFASPKFRASITRKGDRWEVRWQRGLIGGVEPVIGDLAISAKGPDKKTPALIVTAGDFDPEEGVCGLYFRVEVEAGFAITRITPVAQPAKPPKEPRVAHKLAGLLIRSGTAVRYERELYSNLGFFAANRKGNGFFDPLFFWAS